MIEVLRLSHRISRDKRISTHCALVSRAFGAVRLYYSGQKDKEMEESVRKIVEKFGGPFEIEHVDNEYKLIDKKKKDGFLIVHLTCYGLEIKKEITKIRKEKNILVIIGGEKVEPEIYQVADINLSVSNQPHSEVSSLAIFLHEFFEGKELDLKFENAKMRIEPCERGKRVIQL